MDDRPIGVLDSGVGGISVLRSLVRVLPDERYLYYGDTRNAPYGDRAEAEIRALTRAAAEHLLEQGVKALVIACNTATSAAVKVLRGELDIPVIGVEPALKPAAMARGQGKVLVMATAATLRQDKFQSLMERYGQDALVAPCPGLMEFAERGELDSPALDAYLDERLLPLRGERIDAVVLGCTHYVFLRSAVARHVPGARLFDGNLGTARRLEALLTEADARSGGPGSVEFEASDPASLPVMRMLYELPG